MKKIKTKNNNYILKFIVLIFFGITFATIAYANTTYDLQTSANLSLGMQEGVIITNVSTYNVTTNSSYTINHYVETLLNNSIRLTEQNAEVVLEVEVKNTDNVKYRFDGILYDASANQELGLYNNPNVTPEIVNNVSGKMETGEIINENETKTLLVKYTFTGNSFSGTNPGYLDGIIKLQFVRLYSITYNLNGGTQAQNQISYYADGDTTAFLSPTKSRSQFDGWYEDSDFTGSALTSVTNKTGDLTLYAKFYTDRDIYFQMPPDWYKDSNEQTYTVKAYFYNDQTEETYSEWPGTAMTAYTSSDPNITDIYKITINDRYLSNYDRVIFSNGKVLTGSDNATYDADHVKRQTIDLTFSSTNWDQIFVPELYRNSNNSNEVRFFARAKENLHYYIWNTSNAYAPWPGTKITDSIGSSGLKFTFDKSIYDKMIINRGQGRIQTADLTIPTLHDLTFSATPTDFYVTRWFYGGSWYSISNWESAGYSQWKLGDYVSFQSTDTVLASLNATVNLKY